VATDLALVYDPRGHTFQSWAKLMCEAYAAQQLMIPTDDTDWRMWADGLCALDTFTNNGIPTSLGYADWQDWASALVGAVSEVA
jgi:hypothetical protein